MVVVVGEEGLDSVPAAPDRRLPLLNPAMSETLVSMDFRLEVVLAPPPPARIATDLRRCGDDVGEDGCCMSTHTPNELNIIL